MCWESDQAKSPAEMEHSPHRPLRGKWGAGILLLFLLLLFLLPLHPSAVAWEKHTETTPLAKYTSWFWCFSGRRALSFP